MREPCMHDVWHIATLRDSLVSQVASLLPILIHPSSSTSDFSHQHLDNGTKTRIIPSFTDKDVKPGIPHLSLEIALGAELRADSHCSILAYIYRAGSESHNDSPCILSWGQPDAFAAMVLFQHTTAGLLQIHIKPDPEILVEAGSSTVDALDLETPFKVDQYSSRPVHELVVGGRAGT
ncbi:hypothetical protein ONS96_013314 [Cadophora gregata f. sp. sojae]|nr:hypothetical protein ONS96_013314 [Cadophora gregata f. sp. sojae]